MAVTLAKDCQLFVEAAGTTGASIDIEVVTAKDVTISQSASSGDTSNRSVAVKTSRSTLIELRVEGSLDYDPDDEAVALMEAAFHSAAGTIAALVLSTSSTAGIYCDWNVVQWTRNEPLEGGVTIDFALTPASTPASVSL